MQRPVREHIWVEKMSFLQVIIFACRSLFINIAVIYDEHKICPLAKALINLLKKINLGKNFSADKLLLLDKKDASGKTLRYKAYKDLSLCVEKFTQNRLSSESARFKEALRSYMAVNMEPKIIAITKVEAETSPGLSGKKVIYLRANHLNYLVRDFYQDKGFLIRENGRFMEGLKLYVKPYFYLAILACVKIAPFKVKNNISHIRPSVWIEYYPRFMHTCWFDSLVSEEFDVAAYLDRPDTPVTELAVKELEKRKIKWIDAHPAALLKIYKPSTSQASSLLKAALLICFGRPVWLGVFRFEYELMVYVYKSVYTQYKVKVLLQHQEASWKQGPQVQAIEEAGGIMAGYHWSNYHFYLTPTHFFPQHVYFVWGKLMYECLRKKESTSKYILPAGITLAPAGLRVPRPWGSSGNVDFVITVFDDSAPYPRFLSLESLTDFYRSVLGVVEKNKNFGCIIKSIQFDADSLGTLPEAGQMMEIVNNLKAQNRLLFLEPGVSPLEAARSSDLAVGYFINSACAVASVSGKCAAIQWDPAGLLKHPFYKDKRQKFIFDSLSGLESAILSVSKGDKAVGDYAHWKRYISYFDDTQAIKRAGDFIRVFMREEAKRNDASGSLDLAVKKYIAENNVESDFFAIDNCWEDE